MKKIGLDQWNKRIAKKIHMDIFKRTFKNSNKEQPIFITDYYSQF